MKYRITAPFGEIEGVHTTPHTGIDFAFPYSTPLRSIHGGTVLRVTHYPKGVNIGNGVLVKWDDGKIAVYGHMSKTCVHAGDNVNVGDLLGYSGSSGNSTGPHLHFGLIGTNGKFIDPSEYIYKIEHMNDKMYYAENTVHHHPIIHQTIDLINSSLHNINDSILIQMFHQFSQFFS